MESSLTVENILNREDIESLFSQFLNVSLYAGKRKKWVSLNTNEPKFIDESTLRLLIRSSASISEKHRKIAINTTRFLKKAFMKKPTWGHEWTYLVSSATIFRHPINIRIPRESGCKLLKKLTTSSDTLTTSFVKVPLETVLSQLQDLLLSGEI